VNGILKFVNTKDMSRKNQDKNLKQLYKELNLKILKFQPSLNQVGVY